ncbi:MAG: xanthine dehydrogenase family protein molybdopterin-binding subunit [Telmatospirillum sp.]|nr:xanthine dehydrogenase family protein molybdopterin-binding subunit [Telmatospirillum sp.]
MNATFGRRGFLKGAGYVALAFALVPDEVANAQAPRAVLPGDLNSVRRLDAWIRIEAAGRVTLLVGKVELGQGILTAVAQICADELDIDIERIDIVSGDTARVPNEGVTAGSFSMPNCGTAVRHAAAEVRAILLDLAAQKLGVPVETLSVEDGRVVGANAAASYWDLALGQALEREATGTVAPKPAARHRYIGRSVPRRDLPAKVGGAPIFVQDLRLPGMLYGQIARPPAPVATLASVDLAAIERLPGVVKVVRDGSFLGVIARRREQANAAAAQLAATAQWKVEKSMSGDAAIFDWLRAAKPARDIEIMNKQRADGAVPAKTLEARYMRPYHMHGSIGPSAAVATYDPAGSVSIHTHSQSVFETGEAIAKMLGLPRDKVRCLHGQGSGCYGHNMADDAAADAALLARAMPGTPIYLQYTREGEHGWEPYGSAMVIETRAAVDAAGDVLDWNLELWSTPHGTRPGGEAGNLLSARYLEKPFAMPTPANGGPPNYAADRNAIALYDFPGQRAVTHFVTDMPVRVSSTRGLGAYANVFAIESFVDELAHAAGADPVAYRLRHMKDPRALEAIAVAAEKFGWSKWTKREGRGRGIAFARYKNTAAYCAVALEVEVQKRTGAVRVLRAVASNDSGHMVNPDGIANQIEGGLIQSLSWTLKEQVRFDDTRILSRDWADYPILTFSETPPVEVALIDRPGAPFLGTGEASQGPTGAALANAVFDATGVRFRRLPLTPERVRAGLA